MICADGDEFLRSLGGRRFDFIFADTWSGKYRLLDETFALLEPSGIYVIDDMLPQPNWPDGHAVKVAELVARLEERDDFCVTNCPGRAGWLLRRSASALFGERAR